MKNKKISLNWKKIKKGIKKNQLNFGLLKQNTIVWIKPPHVYVELKEIKDIHGTWNNRKESLWMESTESFYCVRCGKKKFNWIFCESHVELTRNTDTLTALLVCLFQVHGTFVYDKNSSPLILQSQLCATKKKSYEIKREMRLKNKWRFPFLPRTVCCCIWIYTQKKK